MSDAKPADDRPARGPLAGFRILDFSSFIMGPYATQQLGDMGADVILVEPHAGVRGRLMGNGSHSDLSPSGMNLLRNKRSLSIDVKTPQGRDAVLQLARSCDAMITNLRDKPLAKLGLGYADLKAVAPHLVYCQAVGFNENGGRADDPAYDDIIQSECGLADAQQRLSGVPTLAATILADKVCGLTVSNAVLAALLARGPRGESNGQHVKLAMLDVMRAFTLLEHGTGALAVPPLGEPGYNRVLSKARGPQRTLDGWLNIMPYSQPAYDALFGVGGRVDLIGSPLTLGRNLQLEADYLYSQLLPIMQKETTQFWIDFCKLHAIPVGRVVSLDEIISEFPITHHPKAGYFREIPAAVSFSSFDKQPSIPAPLVGQHSIAVLQEAGVSPDQIEGLIANAVVRDQSDVPDVPQIDRPQPH